MTGCRQRATPTHEHVVAEFEQCSASCGERCSAAYLDTIPEDDPASVDVASNPWAESHAFADVDATFHAGHVGARASSQCAEFTGESPHGGAT